MKEKVKAKLKKSPAKHPLKASVKDGGHLITITEMFKKQSDRLMRRSESFGSNVVVDIDDDDDVIVVEENSEKTVSSIAKKLDKIPIDRIPVDVASQGLRKRKLSLVKPDQALNSDTSCPSENSKTKSRHSKRDNISASNILVKTSKLTKADKLDINTETTPGARTVTKQNNHKEYAFSEKNKVESPTRNYVRLDSNFLKHSHDASVQFTGDIKSNSSKEINLDISYSPVFSPPMGASEIPPTVNTLGENISGEWQTNSEKLSSDILSSERASNNSDSDNKDIDCDEIIGEDSLPNESQFKVPYYLNNFEAILHSVMEDETNKKLFNEEDLHIITVYQNLSGIFLYCLHFLFFCSQFQVALVIMSAHIFILLINFTHKFY